MFLTVFTPFVEEETNRDEDDEGKYHPIEEIKSVQRCKHLDGLTCRLVFAFWRTSRVLDTGTKHTHTHTHTHTQQI